MIQTESLGEGRIQEVQGKQQRSWRKREPIVRGDKKESQTRRLDLHRGPCYQLRAPPPPETWRQILRVRQR